MKTKLNRCGGIVYTIITLWEPCSPLKEFVIDQCWADEGKPGHVRMTRPPLFFFYTCMPVGIVSVPHAFVTCSNSIFTEIKQVFQDADRPKRVTQINT